MKGSNGLTFFSLILLTLSFSVNSFTLNTEIELESAYDLDNNTFSKNQILIKPEFNFSTNAFDFVSIIHLRNDFKDKLEPGQPLQNSRSDLSERVIIDNDLDIELREFYIEIFRDDSSLRLGKQQIVWGEADGVKLLDVINPQSFNEFILDDFDESRIPLWSVNYEKSLNDRWNLQLLYIPDTTYHEIPVVGSQFEITSPELVPQITGKERVLFQSHDKPSNIFSDGDYGMRFYGFNNGLEYSFNYLYHYLDIPKIDVEYLNDGIGIMSSFQRNHTLGGAFNYALDDWIFRGEAAYKTHQFFYGIDSENIVNSFDTGQLSFLFGVDYQGIDDTFISSQIYTSWIENYNSTAFTDEIENQLTLLIERKFLNENLSVKMLIIQSLNDGDGLVQTDLRYLYSDEISFTLGSDFFHGDEDGLYGQFNVNDRVRFGMELSF